MKTYLDCIPCFFRQALMASRIVGADEKTQKEILNRVSKLISDLSLENTPPEIGKVVYQIVNGLTGNGDPFEKFKKESNKLALKLYPGLKRKISGFEDRILAAMKLAAAGNIIDPASSVSFDINREVEELEKCFEKDFAVFDYLKFKQALKNAEYILYLGDNAGEIVFDRILIEELGKKVIYAVREKPIINDVLINDAYDCGIDKVAKVISSGSDAPGTVLSICSPEFLRIYNRAPLIISKGQGNFEALSEERKPIFFLLKAKCNVIAKDIGCDINDMILKSGLL